MATVPAQPPTIQPPIQPDAQAEHTRRLLQLLLRDYGPRDFAVRFWNGAELPADPTQPTRFTITLRSPEALSAVLLPPSKRAIAEAYVRGLFDFEGDPSAVIEFAHRLPRSVSLPTVARALWQLRSTRARAGAPSVGGARLSGRLHSQQRDREAIRYHFDVSNDFYALWLDRRMVYSCAYFPTGRETLDEAQELKLDYICRKLRLVRGETLLDLGCGWGGLIMHAAERYGVQATGITLSEQQAAFARQRIQERGLADHCRVELLDYRQLQGEARYDKVAAVGMLEHVGENRLPEFFGTASRMLKPGGLFFNQAISWPATNRRATRVLGRLPRMRKNFIRQYVFPDLDLLPLHVILRAAGRAGLELRDDENLREHYHLTLTAWLERLESNWDRALLLVGESNARIWRAYLGYSAYAFKVGSNELHQTLFGKPDAQKRIRIPLSRGDLYE